MRLFIALDIPDPLRDSLALLQQKLIATKANIRWVAPANFHATIKFLGETDSALLPEISARLTRAAAEVLPPSLELDGLAKLPERGQPRVIIIPLRNPDQRVTRLHRLIDSGIGGLGLPMDTRALLPHLTLGRVSNNHNLNKLLRLMEKHAFDPLGAYEPTHVALYQSIPGPTGSTYTRLHNAPLAAKPTPAPQA